MSAAESLSSHQLNSFVAFLEEKPTLRIEKGLATLTQNQESLERIIEQKFYDLDVKVTEIQSVVEQLQEEVEEKKGKSTRNAFARVPRG